MEQEFIKSGTTVMQQGDTGGKAYIIKSGAVDVSTKDENGKDVFLAELGPDNIIGEMTAMCGGARRATVIAKEDLLLTAIPEHDLVSAASGSKKIYNYLAKLINFRKKDTLHKIEEQKSKP